MKTLSHFQLVKLADVARETHQNVEQLDGLLSGYLASWADYLGADSATPAQLDAWLQLDETRDNLAAFLFPDVGWPLGDSPKL